MNPFCVTKALMIVHENERPTSQTQRCLHLSNRDSRDGSPIYRASISTLSAKSHPDSFHGGTNPADALHIQYNRMLLFLVRRSLFSTDNRHSRLSQGVISSGRTLAADATSSQIQVSTHRQTAGKKSSIWHMKKNPWDQDMNGCRLRRDEGEKKKRGRQKAPVRGGPRRMNNLEMQGMCSTYCADNIRYFRGDGGWMSHGDADVQWYGMIESVVG
ncbi:hypothetical protein F5I97DRAFT_702941 [Phlebopus sp. FC_14]|nr:hypothetical protein F5I97DRAFT_702941 [Phlebopus sp. FC_14]